VTGLTAFHKIGETNEKAHQTAANESPTKNSRTCIVVLAQRVGYGSLCESSHMTIARAHLVDPSVTRWYHCVTRCVRRAFLLGEGMHDRKSWIEHRLEELAEIFSVAVAGFAILVNHLHLLVRLDPDVAQGWSDEDVVRRWGRLFPPRDKARQVAPVSEEWVQARLKDARWIATARERLQSLSWFMKCLKEPLSRLANREEKTRGAFFEGRFKSVAILDEESLLATCA